MVECNVVIGRLMENWMIRGDLATIAHIIILNSVTLVNGIHVHRGIGDTLAPVGGPLSRSTGLTVHVLVKLRCRVKVPAQPIYARARENTEDATLMLVEIYPEGLILVGRTHRFAAGRERKCR